MATASYSRAVTMAALQAVSSSIWIAARELSPAKRRLARAGTVAVMSAIGYVATPDEDKPGAKKKEEATTEAGESPADFTLDKRKAMAGAALLGLSLATMAGRRRLEKRWLGRLTRDGHPHPTRALAVRMAGVEFVGQLVVQLADRRKSAR
ncbi:hypothetical protein [Actinoplanes sp. URMC 104]|uniref:hypothetical protein n=1 Tax=Actinoplanes sp. URMC 104 TaxID=3423409 RepID=UPI003F198ABB